jgi:hypothetical protein
MSDLQYSRFLSECMTHDPDRPTGLLGEEMYGVYISWCLLHGEAPASGTAFWAAMKRQGCGGRQRHAGRYVFPGLAMTGPAAVDYILSPCCALRRAFR